MRFLKPLQAWWRRWRGADRRVAQRRKTASAARRRERVAEVELFPRLYDVRLEDRQLLDASPLVQLNPNGVLAVSAGAQASDGAADHFEVREVQGESGTQYAVSVNGEAAGTFAKGDVRQIQVQGSHDADTLVLDASTAPPDGIVFEASGGAADPADRLVLQWTGGAGPTSVQHVLGANQGTIAADWNAGQGTASNVHVMYVGVELIDDGWQAESRSFELADGVSGRLTGGIVAGASRLETSSTVQVDFADPSRSLAVVATGLPAADASPDAARLDVAGTLAIRGGDVRLDAGQQGYLNISATVTTANDSPVGPLSGAGGNIDLLGDRVFLRGGSTIDASGAAHGGQVRIGGDYQGLNAEVRNATQTFIDEGVTIRVDGLGSGDGGRLIIYSDDVAVVWGALSVRGGELGGDGGFVETSGKQFVDIRNAPDLRAPQGRGGTWLIDPNNLTISNGADSKIQFNTTSTTVVTTNDNAVLNINTLRTALAGGDVIVSTTDTKGSNQDGDITLAVDFDFDGIGSHKLTLNAHDDIILNGKIYDSKLGTADQLSLVLNANVGSTDGAIILGNAEISTQGGSIDFQDQTLLQANVTINTTGGSVTFLSDVSADNAATNTRTLTIKAGPGTVDFQNGIGQRTSGALGDLDVVAAKILLKGNVSVDDGNAGQTVTFTGATQISGNVTIDTDVAASTTDNNIRFLSSASTIDVVSGTPVLTITAGSATVALEGDVGATTPIGKLVVSSASALDLQDVRTSGTGDAINLGSASAISTVTLHGNLATDGSGAAGSVRINASNPIQLNVDGGAGSVLIDVDGATSDGALTLATSTSFKSTTSYDDGLALALGDNNLNAVNWTFTDLDHLVVRVGAAQTVTLGALTLGDGAGSGGNGALHITADALSLRGNVSTTGEAQGGDVTVDAATTISSTSTVASTALTINTNGSAGDGAVSFLEAIASDDAANKNRTLVIDAGTSAVLLGGGAGVAGNALSGLKVTGGVISVRGDLIVDDGPGNVTIELNGAVVLKANVLIDVDRASGTDNSLSFGGAGTIDADDATANNRTLAIKAGGGSVLFGGAIGGKTAGALADLDVTAASITFKGNVNVDDGGGQTVTFTGATRLDASVRIDVDVDASTTDNHLLFSGATSTINSATSAESLTIAAGDGNVTLAGDLGGTQALGGLFIESANTVELPNVKTAGAGLRIDLGAVAAIKTLTLRGDLVTNASADAGDIRIKATDPIRLDKTGAASVLIDVDGTNSDGALMLSSTKSFVSTTKYNDGLTLKLGDNSLDASDWTFTELDHLVISVASPNTVQLGALTLGDGAGSGGLGALNVVAGQAVLKGDILTNGEAAAGAVLIDADVTLSSTTTAAATTLTINSDGTSTDAQITITGSIASDDPLNRDRSLEINAGTADLQLRQGAGTMSGGLASLLARADQIRIGGDVIVNDGPGGAFAKFDGAVVLTGNVQIDTDTTGAVDNHLSFTGLGTIDADDSTTHDRTLKINAGTGTVTFGGAIGANANGALADLDVAAGSIQLGGDVFVTDSAPGATVAFSGAVTLLDDVTINTNGTNDASLTFSGPATVIDGDSSASPRELAIDVGGGDVAINGDVGTANAIRRLEIISARNATLGAVNTTGSGADPAIDLGSSGIADTLTLRGDLKTNSSGAAGSIQINAPTVVLDVVGKSATVRFATDGLASDGDVVFTGLTTVKSAVAYDDGATFDIGGGDLDLAQVSLQTLDHLHIITDGTKTVALGAMTLGDGSAAGGQSLAVTAKLVELNGDIATNGEAAGGAIKFSPAVTLLKDVVLNTDGTASSGDVVFESTVYADAGAVGAALTILASKATVEFADTVGASGALGDLDVRALTIYFTDDVNIDGGAGGNTAKLDGHVVLKGDVVFDADGAAGDNSLEFTSLIDSEGTARRLAVVAGAGAVTFGAKIGAASPLADLDVAAGKIELTDDINVSGGAGGQIIRFTGATVLKGDVTLKVGATTANSVEFLGSSSTIDSDGTPRELLIDAKLGDVTLGGAVGGVSPLKRLEVLGRDLDVQSIATTGNGVPQSIQLVAADVLTLRGNLSTDASGAAGNVLLQGATEIVLNPAGGGSVRVDVNGATSDGTLSFGTTTSIRSAAAFEDGLTLDIGDQSIDLTLIAVNSLDHLQVLGGAASIIKLGQTKLGDGAAAADAKALRIVGALTELYGDISTDGQAAGGDIELVSDVVLQGDTLLDANAATSDGDITIARSIYSPLAPHALTIDAGDGAVALDGGAGVSGAALSDLDIAASTIRVGGDLLVDQVGGNTVTLAGKITLADDVLIRVDGNSLQTVGTNSTIDADDQGNRRTLGISAKGGAVTLNGAVGQSEALGRFLIGAADVVVLNGVSTAGKIATNTIDLGSAEPLQSLTLRGDLRTDAGNADGDDAGGIRINSATAVVLDAAGAGTILLDTDADGAAADGGVNFVGGASVTSLAAFEDGLTIRTGDNNVDLSGATLSALDHLRIATGGARTVTLGSITLGDGAAAGGLGALTIDSGTTFLTGDIATTSDPSGNGGIVQFNSKVRLSNDVTIKTDAASADGNVTFNGAVDADDAINNARRLTIVAGSATATFAGDVGQSAALADLDVTAKTIQLAGGLLRVDDESAAAETIELNGDVLLQSNVAIDVSPSSGAPKSLLFGGQVNADAPGTFDRTLTVDATGGDVRFSADVGVAGALAELDVAAKNIVFQSATVRLDDGDNLTSTFTGNVELQNNVRFDLVDAARSNHLTFNGNIVADDPVNFDRKLTISAGAATVLFGGDVGVPGGELADLDVSAGTIAIQGGSILASDGSGNTVTFDGTIELRSSVSISTKSSGNGIVFTGPIFADDSINDRRLVVESTAADVVFNGAVGDGAAKSLADLDVAALNIELNNISLYIDDSSPGGATALFSGTVKIKGQVTIDSDGALGTDNSVDFQGGVQSSSSLSEDAVLKILAGNGTVRFQSDVGGGLDGAMSQVDVSASTITVAGANVLLNDGDGGPYTSTWNGAVRLQNNTTFTTDGAGTDNSLTFAGRVAADDAALFNRTLTATGGDGTIRFQQGVGDAAAGRLADLDVKAKSIQLAGDFFVDDQGGQTITFTGATTLTGDVAFDVDGDANPDNSLLFSGASSTVNADAVANARRLSIQAGTGSVQFDQAIGGAQALGLFQVRSGGVTTLSSVTTAGAGSTFTIDLGSDSPLGQVSLNGDLRTDGATDAGGIRLNAIGPVILQAAGTGTPGTIQLITDATGVDGAIVIANGVNITSFPAYEDGLTIKAGDQSLDLSGASFVALDHVKISTTAAQTVSLGFMSLGDGTGAGTGRALDVSTGTTYLFGDVLADADSSGKAGAVSLQSSVRLSNNVRISTNGTTDADVTITGLVDADDAAANDRRLAIDAGLGRIEFGGDLGGAQALAELDLTASTISFSGAKVNVNDGLGGRESMFDGVVLLKNNVAFRSDAAGSGNQLVFLGNVRADDASTNNRTLSIVGGAGLVRLSDVGGGTNGTLADFDIEAATIQLNGNLSARDQGGAEATLKGNVQLLTNVVIDTSGTAANAFRLVGSSSAIDADSAANNRQLTLTTGAGDLTLDGALGASQRLGDVVITSANNVVASGNVFAGRFEQTAGAGDSTYLGRIDSNGAGGVLITTQGKLSIGGGVTTTGGGNVLFRQQNGLQILGDIAADGAITEDGKGDVEIAATRSVSSTGDAISFTNHVTLSGGGSRQVVIRTTEGGNTAGADITLKQGVDAKTAAPQAEQLVLDAGTAGDVDLLGVVGAASPLGSLLIVQARDVTAAGSVNSGFVSQMTGTGNTLFRGAITTSGSAGVSLVTQGTIDVQAIATSNGGSVTFQNGDRLTLNGNISSDGAVRQLTAGAVTAFAGNKIVTSGDPVTFTGPLSIAGASRGGTLRVETSGGGISFSGSIDSIDATPRGLVLAAGAAGDVNLTGAIGSVNKLSLLRIESARDVNTKAVTVEAFDQVSGAGNTTIGGNLTTTGVDGAKVVTQGNIVLANDVIVLATDIVSLKSQGSLTLSPNSQINVTNNALTSTVKLNAGGTLNFDPTAVVRVGASRATSRAPTFGAAATEFSPGVNIDKSNTATVDLLVSDPIPSDNNYVVAFDWGDGPVLPSFDQLPIGTIEKYSHTYIGNPGPDPTSPIPISVTLAFDPRIVMTENGGTVLGRATEQLVLLPPTSGIFGFNVIVPNNGGLVRTPELRAIAIAVIPTAPTEPIMQRFDFGTSASVATTVRSRQLVLNVVLLDPDGRPVDSDESILLNEDVLDNLPELFQSLPDDRYRIYMKLENGSRRLVKDIVIRNRKAVELEETAETPMDAAPMNKAPMNEASREQLPLNGPRELETPAEPEREAPGAAQGVMLGGALALAAEKMAQRGTRSWNDRVRRTLTHFAHAARSRWSGRSRKPASDPLEEKEFPQ
ncbi:MAG: hypothetical protein U0939_20620 [Pirellulales bacterium]